MRLVFVCWRLLQHWRDFSLRRSKTEGTTNCSRGVSLRYCSTFPKENITFFSSFSSSLSSHSHEHKSNEMSFCVHISLLAKIFCNHTKQCISQHFESYQLNDHHPHCCYDHHHQPELQNVQSITQSKNSNQTLSPLASTSSSSSSLPTSSSSSWS